MDNCEVSKRQVLLSFVYEDRPYRVIASLGNVSADDVVIFIEQHVMDTKENKEKIFGLRCLLNWVTRIA